MFKLKYLLYTTFSSSLSPYNILQNIEKAKQISNNINYKIDLDSNKGLKITLLLKLDNIQFKILPLSSFKSETLTILNQQHYKKYDESGKERPLYNHEILKLIAEETHFPISKEKLLNTYLDNQSQKSLLQIFNMINISYIKQNNNTYMTFSINDKSLFNEIKINPLYTDEKGVLPLNYITYEFGTFNQNGIIKASLHSDLNKHSTLLNHVLPIESLKFIVLAGYESSNYTIYISGIAYYKYDIEALLKQYKNIKPEELHKVQLNTENNGNAQIEMPIGINIMKICNIEVILTNNFQNIIYLVKFTVINQKIHELSLKIKTAALDLKNHMNSIQNSKSLEITCEYSINLNNGSKLIFKFTFDPLKIKNNESGWNPFVPTYFNPKTGIAVMPSFNVCISYDSKKNQLKNEINDALNENNTLNLNF